MALYRPASRRPLVAIAAVGLAGGLALGFLAGRASAPDVAAVIDGLRERVAAVSSALEVLRVEYAETAAGDADPGAAEQALARAQAAWDGVEADLALIDATAADDTYQALGDLRQLVDARAPAAQVEAAIDAVMAHIDAILSSGGGQ